MRRFLKRVHNGAAKRYVLCAVVAVLAAVLCCVTAYGEETGPWKIHVLENGERCLYNEETGEIIYQPMGYDEDGKLVEIPLEDLLVMKNTGIAGPVEENKEIFSIKYTFISLAVIFGLLVLMAYIIYSNFGTTKKR